MRVPVFDLERLKQAAKYLVRESFELKLSATHELLASALGYRDWHELSGVARFRPRPPQQEVCVDDFLNAIVKVADMAKISPLEVQYALSRAQILFGGPSSLEQQLQLCCAVWRKTLFGVPGRGKPGTIVKDKAYGSNEPAYLLRAGRPTYVLFDTGPGTRADFEVATPLRPLADFVPSRLWLPYGYWTLRDGSEVIFSRDYFPLWRIMLGTVERLEPWLWIGNIAGEFHFAKSMSRTVWATGIAREHAVQFLKQRRIFELPRLLSAMPYLFTREVDSIGDAVRMLSDIESLGRDVPPYAEFNSRLHRYR